MIDSWYPILFVVRVIEKNSKISVLSRERKSIADKRKEYAETLESPWAVSPQVYSTVRMSMTCHWVTALQSQRFQDTECCTGSGMLISTSVFLKTFNLQKYAELKSNIFHQSHWFEDVWGIPHMSGLPQSPCVWGHFVQALSVDWYQVLISKDQKTLSELRWGFSRESRGSWIHNDPHLVGGDWNHGILWLSHHIGKEFHHPNRLSYFSEGLKPPTRHIFEDVHWLYEIVDLWIDTVKLISHLDTFRS